MVLTLRPAKKIVEKKLRGDQVANRGKDKRAALSPSASAASGDEIGWPGRVSYHIRSALRSAAGGDGAARHPYQFSRENSRQLRTALARWPHDAVC
jgi:hypothetical protein